MLPAGIHQTAGEVKLREQTECCTAAVLYHSRFVLTILAEGKFFLSGFVKKVELTKNNVTNIVVDEMNQNTPHLNFL